MAEIDPKDSNGPPASSSLVAKHTLANKAVAERDDNEFSTYSSTKWDKQVEWYARFERYELPAIITCAEFTNVPLKRGAILEVACGPGLHAETLAKSFLKGQGSTLVSCDFSKGMVEQMKCRFEESDYRSLPGAKFIMDTETDYANLQSDSRVDLESVMEQNKPFDKLVYGCLADNMKLPFADNTFEAYISNLSLMIV